MFQMDFCVPLPRFLYFIAVPGPQKEIYHGHLGEKWPSSQWISLQFVFSVLTKWNGFQIMNAFLLELVVHTICTNLESTGVPMLMVNNRTSHSKRPSDDRLRSAWAFYLENFFNISAGTWTEIVVINERYRSEVWFNCSNQPRQQKNVQVRIPTKKNPKFILVVYCRSYTSIL